MKARRAKSAALAKGWVYDSRPRRGMQEIIPRVLQSSGEMKDFSPLQ